MNGLGFAGSCSVAFAAAWALCEAWQLLIRRRREAAFGALMVRRVAALLGRTVLLLLVVAVGIARLDGHPGGIVTGAMLGWLLAAGREVRQREGVA